MQLILDSRESRLLQDLEKECEKEYLALGDVLFKDDTIPAEIRIERKTWGDLWGSIQDGRYREQRSRLLDHRQGAQECTIVVLYLIEGSHRGLSDEASDTCRRALLRLQMVHHIPIVYTSSFQDTVEWIRWVHEKKDLSIFFKTSDTHEQRVENIQTRLGNQKSSIQNPKTMLITFLRSISGVSYVVASTIAEPFASLTDFIQRKEELTNMLPVMEYTTPSQKKRRVGPKLAEKIVMLIG
jgi:ERCC4-type nuclease